jgi:hypothetical protein
MSKICGRKGWKRKVEKRGRKTVDEGREERGEKKDSC